MKFDLHCHTKEGSIDSKVSVREYASKFMAAGYDGFMIADHNSYKGCHAWNRIKHEPQYKNFVVINGIEYDTKDAGHVLIIMPDNIYLSIFRIRGMHLKRVIRIVHAFGGIVGLAHPYGISSSSAMGFKLMNNNLIRKLDFIETFNTCESRSSNGFAALLAAKYGLVGFAGSDAHVPNYIGMACTEIDADISCNNDLIKAVKKGAFITVDGTERETTKKAKRKEHWTGVLGYRLYNRGLSKLFSPYRAFRHYKLSKVS